MFACGSLKLLFPETDGVSGNRDSGLERMRDQVAQTVPVALLDCRQMVVRAHHGRAIVDLYE